MATAFARNIKAIREDNGLKQYELAEKLDVDRITANNWEKGKVKAPRQKEVIDAIKTTFGVTDRDLFGYDDGYFAKTRGLSGSLAGDATERQGMKMGLAPKRGMAHAGILDDPDVYDEETMVRIPQFLLDKDPDSYVISSIGDCMNKVFGEGPDLVVSPNAIQKDRSIVLATIEGLGSIIRRLHMGSNTWILSPESYSDEYDDIIITSDDERAAIIDGVITWYQAPRELA